MKTATTTAKYFLIVLTILFAGGALEMLLTLGQCVHVQNFGPWAWFFQILWASITLISGFLVADDQLYPVNTYWFNSGVNRVGAVPFSSYDVRVDEAEARRLLSCKSDTGRFLYQNHTELPRPANGYAPIQRVISI